MLRTRWALLFFYPFAFSGICTRELVGIQAEVTGFQNSRVQVLAISCDAMFTQRAFAQANELDFPLLSDFWPHGEVARAYGVFDERAGMPMRGTFLVAPDGTVRWSMVNPPGQARELAEVAEAVGRHTA